MATSQNGWPVDKTGSSQDRNPIYGNVKVPNGVRKGDVATVLRWVAERYNATVEPLVAGTCWGWFVKSIEGSKSISNHASGTAIDLNADQHPMGVAASKNFTAKQIAACHAIVKAAGGVIRWGGDYTGRPDPMHWEIVGSAAATAALAKKIMEDDVALTAADWTKLQGMINTAVSQVKLDAAARVDDILNVKIGDKANPGRTVGDVLRDFAKLRGWAVGDGPDTKNAAIPDDAPVRRIARAAEQIIGDGSTPNA